MRTTPCRHSVTGGSWNSAPLLQKRDIRVNHTSKELENIVESSCSSTFANPSCLSYCRKYSYCWYPPKVCLDGEGCHTWLCGTIVHIYTTAGKRRQKDVGGKMEETQRSQYVLHIGGIISYVTSLSRRLYGSPTYALLSTCKMNKHSYSSEIIISVPPSLKYITTSLSELWLLSFPFVLLVYRALSCGILPINTVFVCYILGDGTTNTGKKNVAGVTAL